MSNIPHQFEVLTSPAVRIARLEVRVSQLRYRLERLERHLGLIPDPDPADRPN